MIKHRMHLASLFLVLLVLGMSPAWSLDINVGSAGSDTYKGTYKGKGAAGMCTTKGLNKAQAKLVTQSINKNLKEFKSDVVNRVETWGDTTSRAIATLSAGEANNFEQMKAELINAQDKALKLEQLRMIDQKTLEATRAMEPSVAETKIVTGLSYYRPELPVAFRQSEMQRYISELNNVPLDNKYRGSNGMPLPGYVDTAMGDIAAVGQEFRNFVRLFCDARSLNGRVASTKFIEFDNNDKPVGEYWCGQDRGLGAPQVQLDISKRRYDPITGNELAGHVREMSRAEIGWSKQGKGRLALMNAPKNVAELYFEPRSLTVKDQDVYEKAEQEFARLVIGRAGPLNNVSDLNESGDQRKFMTQQARIAKLALARYPFAEMFSQKVPSMPEGSAQWAAELIEANLGDCKTPDEGYKQLCNLTKQLRAKTQISESEFFDVLFSRQFQGMAFNTQLVKMSEGQMKRLQTNVLGLQLALNYKRNRLKEPQLALMAAIYAQQAQ